MTSAFNFAVPPDPSPPNLDHPARQLPKLAKCVPNAVLGFLNEGLPYRVPYPQTAPAQESGPAREIPSSICQLPRASENLARQRLSRYGRHPAAPIPCVQFKRLAGAMRTARPPAAP